MKELKKLSLEKELDREAQNIEEEIKARKDLDGLTVSEEAETALFNRIQEYEYDRRFRETARRGRKKRRILLAVAAVLVLICGSVITGTGSKSYLQVLMERLAGGEKATLINIDDMDSQKTEDTDEIQIFYEIREKTGISPVHFGYMPKKMHLKRYEISGERARAVLIYDYNGQTVQYSMYMNDADSSYGYTEQDELVDEYTLTAGEDVEVEIREYEVVNRENHRFIADFEYRNARYQLVGLMEKDEYDKIIENLRFYD